MKNYVFLICSERSGSNLICSILRQHNQVHSPLPLQLFRDLSLNFFLLDHSDIKSLKESFEWKILVKNIVRKFRNLYSEQASIDVMNYFANADDLSFKKIFLDLIAIDLKYSPQTSSNHSIIFLKENNFHKIVLPILSYFPDAKFVFQVRDPRDYMASCLDIAKNKGFLGNKFNSSFRALELWKLDQMAGLNALKHLGPSRVFVQKYEDLIEHPEKVLSKLCSFLHIQYMSSMLNFFESEQEVKLAIPGGPRENLSKPIIRNNKNKYLKVLDADLIRRIEIYLAPLMLHFNYELTEFNNKNEQNINSLLFDIFYLKFSEPIEKITNKDNKSPWYTEGLDLSNDHFFIPTYRVNFPY